jgi:hypothetical protein
MIARISGLIILLLANWLVWRPPGSAMTFDLDGLRTGLIGECKVREERFPPSPMLPDDYALFVADGDQPLRSIYVGFYPTQGLAAEGPHDPHDCYATQGWDIRSTGKLELKVDGKPAVVQTAVVESPGNKLFVTWWSQRPGGAPGDPDQRGALQDLLDRWRRGRSDLCWVRIEWDPSMADMKDSSHLCDVLAKVIAAADRAFQR